MCGIAGYIGVNKFYPKNESIKGCLKLMQLRGPDSQSFKEFSVKKIKALFCTSRLSIIDLDKRSNQPFEDENGVLSFNGEIYNYLELKKKLKKKKIQFKTKSDTEVLLKFLNTYGVEKLKEIQGMWSFIYFSKKQKRFYLSRDNFGEKPLFFYLNEKVKSLIFGSNVNYVKKLSFLKHKVNKDKIFDYLRYGFRSVYSNEQSFFQDIKFVKPGELIEINEDFKISILKYVKYPKYNSKINSYNLAKKILKKKINHEIPRSLRSDVPIAVLLSGGVDSSLIAYLAKKKIKNVKFYSYKQKDELYDESKKIILIKKKFNLQHEFISENNINKNFKLIDNLIQDIGFPLLSTTNLALNKICQKIKKDGYKVLITGNGGDEIFSGYYSHHMSYLISIKKKENYSREFKKWNDVTRPHVRTGILKDVNLFNKNLRNNAFNFETDTYKKYFRLHKKNKKNLYKINEKKDLFIDHLDNDLFLGTLPAQTHTVDSISMHHSLESRMPLLNDNLYIFRNQISKNFLIRNGMAKYILRDTFKKKLPKKILFDSEKTGFFLPLKETINFKSKKFINIIFQNEYLNKIIKIDTLKKKLNSGNLSQQDQKFIFLLYNAASFLKLNT